MEIKPQYQHSKIGNFLFNICACWTKFIAKHKILYYTLACTWGIILTALGWIISLILFTAKQFKKGISFKKYYWIYYIKVGPAYWGGLEMGLTFLRDFCSKDHNLNCHEFGHGIQNTILGPLFIPLVFIPSALRYWVRDLFPKQATKPYDAFWAEDSASQCGEYLTWYLDNFE